MVLKELISGLDCDESLVIICQDSNVRKMIHSYIEESHDVGHIGILLDKYPNDTKTGMRCYNCEAVVWLEYNYGSMENNKDEYYSGMCGSCLEFVSYECNYDCSRVFRVEQNNAICVGEFIQLKSINNPVDHQNIDEQSKELEIFLIKSPDLIVRSRCGRKGRRKLNKKREKIANFVKTKI